MEKASTPIDTVDSAAARTFPFADVSVNNIVVVVVLRAFPFSPLNKLIYMHINLLSLTSVKSP